METNTLSRRTLLTAAACAPAIAVVALLTKRWSVPAVSAVEPEPEPAVSGYHETEHIRKYYRAAAYF